MEDIFQSKVFRKAKLRQMLRRYECNTSSVIKFMRDDDYASQIDKELGATDGNITFEELVSWYEKTLAQ